MADLGSGQGRKRVVGLLSGGVGMSSAGRGRRELVVQRHFEL
jgi:hypothetical protein